MNTAGVFLTSFLVLWGAFQILLFAAPYIDACGCGSMIGAGLSITLLLGVPMMLCVVLAKDKSP